MAEHPGGRRTHKSHRMSQYIRRPTSKSRPGSEAEEKDDSKERETKQAHQKESKQPTQKESKQATQKDTNEASTSKTQEAAKNETSEAPQKDTKRPTQKNTKQASQRDPKPAHQKETTRAPQPESGSKGKSKTETTSAAQSSSSENQSKERTERTGRGDDNDDDEERDWNWIRSAPFERKIPMYFHIGACAKECLLNGYRMGIWQLRGTSESKSLVFGSFGNLLRDKTLIGGLGLRKKFELIDLAQNWYTNDMLSTEVTAHTDFNKGSLVSSLLAKYGVNGSDLSCNLRVALNLMPIDAEIIVPVVNEPRLLGCIAVKATKNFLLGFRTTFDMENKNFDMYALALGYYNGRTEVGLKWENFRDWRGSVFQRIGESWALALKMNLYRDDGPKFAIGGQYKLAENWLFKAKVRSDGFLGLVLNSQLAENMDVTYHAGLDIRCPIKGEHKLGVAWNFSC